MNPLVKVRCAMQAQFYDIDPMHVVWHGHYTRFFEEARSELLNLINYNYEEMEKSGFMWPVVDLRIKYIRPLFLHQKFFVEAGLVEYTNRLKIDYQILDSTTLEVLTKAHTIQVAVRASDHEMQFESPEILLLNVKKVLK